MLIADFNRILRRIYEYLAPCRANSARLIMLPKRKGTLVTLPLNTAPVRAWVAEAGTIARRYFGHAPVEHKDDNSPVTVADRAIERFLSTRIRETYPDHGIIGEEFGSDDADREFLWVIDPIDGTQAYIDGLPTWCITVALLHDRVPEFGLTYLPLVDDWTYTDGDDVICNGEVITNRLKTVWGEHAHVFTRSDALTHYHIPARRILTMSSTASHIAYTARGSAAATVTHGGYLWDIAAGLAFMRKQGGEVRFLDGVRVDFTQRDLFAPLHGVYAFGHPAVLDSLLPTVELADRPEPIMAQ